MKIILIIIVSIICVKFQWFERKGIGFKAWAEGKKQVI